MPSSAAATPSWSYARWHCCEQRPPTSAFGEFRQDLGKVFVWVLTEADIRAGRTATMCGFHLASSVFEDHDQEGEGRVVYWSEGGMSDPSLEGGHD